MPRSQLTSSLLCAIFVLFQASATVALETYQDPKNSPLLLFNSHVLSYFGVCDVDDSVHVDCRYGRDTCDDYSETTNFTVENSTCVQIAFLHRKDEVVNGTRISLVIRNATTLQELRNFHREFVLTVLEDGFLPEHTSGVTTTTSTTTPSHGQQETSTATTGRVVMSVAPNISPEQTFYTAAFYLCLLLVLALVVALLLCCVCMYRRWRTPPQENANCSFSSAKAMQVTQDYTA